MVSDTSSSVPEQSSLQFERVSVFQVTGFNGAGKEHNDLEFGQLIDLRKIPGFYSYLLTVQQ